MYHRILVPLDGSPTAERGLHEAVGIAKDGSARLILLHVVNDSPLMLEMSTVVAYEELRSRLRQAGEEVLSKGSSLAAAAGVPCETALREITEGRAADAIVEEARSTDCGLIVMGTHGRRGLSRMVLGSDAELVARTSPVPVLLVRHEEAKA